MKRFLAVFTGTEAGPASWERLSDQERAKRQGDGIAAWTKWAQDHAADIVEAGGPLSRTLRISPAGVAETRNNLAAFTIVQAENQHEAAAMFIDHPHFSIFPGDGVEVMEVLPVPSR